MTKLEAIRARDQAWTDRGGSGGSNASQAAQDRKELLAMLDALIVAHADLNNRILQVLR